MYKYKIIKDKEIEKYKKELISFYKKEKQLNDHYLRSLKNSSFVVICLYKKSIIGSVRVISDLREFALLMDLFVAKKFRKKGIGTKIMGLIINECRKIGIKNLSLLVDCKKSWLLKWYQRLGFKKNKTVCYMNRRM